MQHGQGSWALGLLAGLLLAGIIWFAINQFPNGSAPAQGNNVFDRVSCLKAAFNASSCIAKGRLDEHGTFRHANQTYPCHCNTEAVNETGLPSITGEPVFNITASSGPTSGSVGLASNASWLYVLTGYEKPGLVQRLMDTPADGLVVDAFQSTPNVPFSKDQVAGFKKNHSVVLAYVSIGEAEEYRNYWNPEWKATPPAWMGKVNPEYPGNFKVKYWDPAWQALVFDYVDQIVGQGFDGAYLDIIDGYQYWSDPLNGETEVLSKDDAAQRMIAFIQAIRQHARVKNPAFKIFPQNAQELVDYPGYLDAIDGIGREDTWYVGYDDKNAPGSLAKAQDEAKLTEQLAPLIKIQQAGKTALVVDYFEPSQKAESDDFAQQARKLGFYPYAADTRKLDNISSLQNAGQVTTEVVGNPIPNTIRGLETRSDHAVRLTQGPGSDQNPAFLNSKTLIFSRFSQGYNQGPADLMQLDVATGNETTLLSNGAQNVNVNGNPFTPDRQKICFASDLDDADEIWCMNLKNGTTTRMTNHDGATQFIEPTVSNDNATTAFEVHSNAATDSPGQLWTTDNAGNAKIVLSDNVDNRLPMFNPMDGRILFQRKTGEFWRLTLRYQNGTLEELTIPTQGGTDATWSNAQEILYSSEGSSLAHPKIFSFDLNTKTGREETFDPSVEDGAPAVSSDGKWLAFESHINADENSPTRIWLIRRD